MTMEGTASGGQAAVISNAASSAQDWKLVSQILGGTITALAISPTFAEDQLILAGTSVGIYRSTDGGESWKPVEGMGSPFIQAITFSPTYEKDGYIFIGTLNSGIYRSPDHGTTWLQLPFGYSNGTVTTIVLSPHFADDGVVIVGTAAEGVFRSINRGQTWSQQNFGLMALDVQSLVVSPNFAEDETLFAVTMDGLFRSTNGARAWRQVERGLDSLAPQALVISPNFTSDRTVWVTTEDFGIYRSTDGGTSWKEASEGLPSDAVNAIVVREDGTLFCGTADGAISRSTNGGQNWQVVHEAQSSPLALAAGPDGLLLAGLHQNGVIRSNDDGATWQEQNTNLAAHPLLGLTISPAFEQDQSLFVCGLQDGILKSTDSGATWQPASNGLPTPAAAAIAISPRYAEDHTLYAATPKNVFRSKDGGDSWEECSLEVDLDQELRSIAVTHSREGDGLTVAVLAPHTVWISRDSGDNWLTLGETFNSEELLTVSFSPNYAQDGTLFVTSRVLPAITNVNMVSVWRSSDGGRTWTAGLRQKTNSSWVAFAVPATYRYEPGVLGDVFAASGDFFFRTMQPNKRMWVSEHIGGATTSVVSLATSPAYASDKTVVAGTTDGVLISRDGGLNWTNISSNIGNWPVPAIIFAPNYSSNGAIFALTAGSSLWRYEDQGKQ